MANEFRGEERRALEKIIELFDYIDRRDLKTYEPKLTSSICTRETVVANDNPHLQGAFRTVRERVNECLGLPHGSSLSQPEMSPAMKSVLHWGARAWIGTLKDAKEIPGTTYYFYQISEDGCLVNVIAPEDSGTDPGGLMLDYTWAELAIDQVSFRTKAFDTWGDEAADYFLP